MREIEELEDNELIVEYRETVAYRAIESEEGQVSPKQIQLKRELESEILERMK